MQRHPHPLVNHASPRPLEGVRVLMFVGDDYEDLELWYPKLRLEEAGGHVTLAGSMQGRTYSGNLSSVITGLPPCQSLPPAQPFVP